MKKFPIGESTSKKSIFERDLFARGFPLDLLNIERELEGGRVVRIPLRRTMDPLPPTLRPFLFFQKRMEEEVLLLPDPTCALGFPRHGRWISFRFLLYFLFDYSRLPDRRISGWQEKSSFFFVWPMSASSPVTGKKRRQIIF